MKRYHYAALCALLVGTLITGCPANNGGLTGPSTAAPILSDVTTSAASVSRGGSLIFYIGFVDLSGDVNNGLAIVNDRTYRANETKRYESTAYTDGTTSGTLEITITIDLLTNPGPDHYFTIVVSDRAGNWSNEVPAFVDIL